MICEELRVPGLPGAEDVTDGSVDWYAMDWTNVDNGILEEEMPRCSQNTCIGRTACTDNRPEQTDVSSYEMVLE